MANMDMDHGAPFIRNFPADRCPSQAVLLSAHRADRASMLETMVWLKFECSEYEQVGVRILRVPWALVAAIRAGGVQASPMVAECLLC